MKNSATSRMVAQAIVLSVLLVLVGNFSVINAQTTLPNRNIIPFGFNNGSLLTFRSVTIHNPVTYVFPANLISTLGANALVDLGDGQGNRPLNGQSTWTINYASAGAKDITFRTNPNDQFPVKTKITIKTPQRAYVAPDRIWRITTNQTWSRPSSCANAYPTTTSATLPLPIFRNTSFDDQLLNTLNGSAAGSANAYIKFGKENGVARTYLSRPVIVLDGIDFGSYTFQLEDATLANTSNFESKVIRHGDTGWDILWTGTEESKTEHETFGMYPNFFDQLSNAGYDIIFLDFQRGADYIQRNTLLFMELLKRVNQTKRQSPGCAAKNMVIGPSMGGQIARIGLAMMEQQGLDHDTHTYLSFDSPHRGANIPLGVQAAAYWAHRASINTGQPSLWQSLNLPAARQLIIDNLGSAENSRKINVSTWEDNSDFLTGRGNIRCLDNSFSCLRQQYVTELAQIGYPQRTRNVALACGSFTGTGQGYNTNDHLFSSSYYENAGGFGYAFRFDIWASRGNNHNLNVRRVSGCSGPGVYVTHLDCYNQPLVFGAAIPDNVGPYLGTFAPCSYLSLYVRHITTNYPSLDNAPGGKRQDLASLNDLLLSVVKESPGLDVNQLNITTFPEERKNLSFIPTISAFDINQPLTDANLFQNVFNNRINFIQNGTIPFEEIFAPNNNIQHVEVNNDMITWVMGQVQTSVNLLQPNIGSSITNATYNFANRRRDNIPTVNIGNNGVVRVNAAGNAGFGNEVNNAPNPFNVIIDPSCGNSTVTVQNNGTLRLGDGARLGNIRVRNGGNLRIETNGNLVIEPNSQLIIENGGKLIVESNANINLVGTESKIVIQSGGQLVLNSGTFQPTGQGHLRLEPGHIIPNTGNLVLRGANNTHKFLVLAKDAQLNVLSGSFTMDRGKVQAELPTPQSNPSYIRIAPSVTTVNMTDVTFDGPSGISGNSTFMLFDQIANHNAVMTRCTLNTVGSAIRITAPIPNVLWTWANVNMTLNNTHLNNASFVAERGYQLFFNNSRVDNGTLWITNTYWLKLENTILKGIADTLGNNRYGYGIRGTDLIHCHLLDNTLISGYQWGVANEIGINANVYMDNNTTIQNCDWGVRINGGFLPDPYGMVYMNGSRLIKNKVGVEGQDILFSIYARSKENVFRTDNSTNSRFFKSLFRQRNDAQLWFHGNFWNTPTLPTSPTPTNNNYWEFRQQPIPQTINDWSGTFNVNPFASTGDINLRGGDDDPMEKDIIVRVSGVDRNLKVQRNAAEAKLKGKKLKDALDLFEPIALINNATRETASDPAKHVIDMARIFVFKKSNQVSTRSNDGGWLPESRVRPDVKTDGNHLVLFPSPTSDQFQIDLEQGNYTLTVHDALGRLVESRDIQGATDVVTKSWQNGIYMVKVINQTTKTTQQNKIVIQH
jgi:Secretion system C-terminal sorting domain